MDSCAKLSLRESKNTILTRSKKKVIFVYVLFLIANIIYLNVFAMNIEKDSEYFFYPLNLDQRKSYIPIMKELEECSFEIGRLSNTEGIAYIYYLLKKGIGFSYDAISLVSFIVNNIFVLFCYWYFVRVGLQLGLKMNYRWLFFLNPALVYYSQLINKEILSLFFVLAFTYYLGQKQSFKLFLVSLISFGVRLQLLPIGILSFWLYRQRRYILSIFLLYLITSMVSAIVISPNVALDSAQLLREDGSPGLTVLLQSLNQQYYIGSIVLNPVKIIQYLYDLLLSVLFITDDGRINLYYLRDVPFVLALVYLFRPLMTLFVRMSKYMNTPCRPLITVTCVYMIVLLMHFLVHARYLFPISYNVILLGVFVGRDLERTAKERHASRVKLANLGTIS